MMTPPGHADQAKIPPLSSAIRRVFFRAAVSAPQSPFCPKNKMSYILIHFQIPSTKQFNF
jgi:hypothetical protein